MGDVVRQVGGDSIELTTLMSIGIDPHSYVPTPADSAAIHDAHVVFASGAGLESDLKQVFESAGGDAVRVYLSDGLEHRLVGGTIEEDGDGHGHDEGDVDPHVWFDVRNVIHWVETIEQALSALDPANAAAYQANAAAYTQELEELDAWVVEQVAAIPQANRKLVTNHPSFGYLARPLWPGASRRRLSLQPLGRAVGPGHCRAGGYHSRVWRAGRLYREHGQPQAGRAGGG